MRSSKWWLQNSPSGCDKSDHMFVGTRKRGNVQVNLASDNLMTLFWWQNIHCLVNVPVSIFSTMSEKTLLMIVKRIWLMQFHVCFLNCVVDVHYIHLYIVTLFRRSVDRALIFYVICLSELIWICLKCLCRCTVFTFFHCTNQSTRSYLCTFPYNITLQLNK